MRHSRIATGITVATLTAVTLITGPVVVAQPFNEGSRSVATATGPVVATIEVGASPTDSALDADQGRLYVLEAVTPRVTVISTATNTVVDTIDVVEEAMYLTLDAARNQLFVTNGHPTLSAGSFSVVDLGTNTLTATTPLRGEPRKPVLDADRGLLFIVQAGEGNSPGTLTTVDATTSTILTSIGLGVSPGEPSLEAATGRLYIPMNSTVAIYDTESYRRVANVKVGRFPAFVVLDPSHHRFFAIRLDGLVVVDTRTNRATASVRMDISIDQGPPALDAARQRLYLPTSPYRGRIVVMDARTTRVKARITVGIVPDGPVLDAARRLLYVPEFDEGSGRTVYVVDTSTNRLVNAIAVGRGPEGPVLDAASGRVYVRNWVPGTVSVIDMQAVS